MKSLNLWYTDNVLRNVFYVFPARVVAKGWLIGRIAWAVVQAHRYVWTITHADGFNQVKVGPSMVEMAFFLREHCETMRAMTFEPIGGSGPSVVPFTAEFEAPR